MLPQADARRHDVAFRNRRTSPERIVRENLCRPHLSRRQWDVQRRVAARTSVLPLCEEDRSLCGFSHIFAGGYSAGYYSYKWAEVLSADAFSAFEEAGLDDETAVAETGRRFRETILSQGGGKHPMELYKEFRGREPNAEALLRHNDLI